MFVSLLSALRPDRWQDEPESPGGFVHVSHNVTNFEFLYEPFYVAADSVPPHDERFMGYGYTRNTQVGERRWAINLN